jgi:transcriptional regulator with GAF, ATPase, and Fis domain
VPPGAAFVTLLAELSTRFAALPAQRVSAQIDHALDALLDHFGTDRISLIELREADESLVVAHSRVRPGAEGVPSVLGRTAAATWYAPRLRAGEVVRLDRIPDDLPPEAREELDHAVRFAFRSHVAVPVSVAGRWICALATATCADYRRWSDETVQEVRIVGQLLANALHRAQLEGELRESVDELRRLRDSLRAENEYLREEIDVAAGFERIVGRSPALRRALELAAQVAETPASVLLLGETGTGKDLIARAIHARSPRRERAFIRVNCAALPPSLVESELFGYEKGAFTGATSSKPGRFELAHEGTLFLDEIGELPAEVQAKLLRVLQDGEFERLGAVQTRKVDVRLVAATNRDLGRAMAGGGFREDLFYRIAAFPIQVPPLRDRPEDVPLLAWDFLHRRGPELGRRIERIPEAALAALSRYAWPGNVRELGNVLERALILSKGPELRLDPAFAGAERRTPAGLGLLEVEREHIVRVLEKCRWKINGPGNAAETLGLHPNTLRARLRKLGLARPASTVRQA